LSKTQSRAQKRANKEQPEHVTSEDMAAFVEGCVSAKPLEAITEHLADCPECRKTVARVTASQDGIHNPSRRKRR
jgi:anti-sigma factor RsiW